MAATNALLAFGSEQAKAISLASFSPSKISGNGRRRSWLATQHSLEAFFHQLFADPVNHGCAGLQGLDDLVVAPSFAGFRGVRLQQNPRLHQPLRRAASFPGQCRKLLTFLAAQPHNIFLYDNFPCSHDRLRRSVATKANHQILSNWLKRTTSGTEFTIRTTVSDKGRDARDIMLGLAKTCMKLKLSFYEFIGARLGIPGPKIPPLASLIRPAPA